LAPAGPGEENALQTDLNGEPKTEFERMRGIGLIYIEEYVDH
jgi:hypothetical protein